MSQNKLENWEEMFRKKFHNYTMDDPRDVMVEEMSGELEDFVYSLLEEQKLAIRKEIEYQVEDNVTWYNKNNPISDDEWSLNDENREYLYKVVENTKKEIGDKIKNNILSSPLLKIKE